MKNFMEQAKILWENRLLAEAEPGTEEGVDEIASFGSADNFIDMLSSDTPDEAFDQKAKPMSRADYAKAMADEEAAPEEDAAAPADGAETKEPEAPGAPKYFIVHMKGQSVIGSFESRAISPKAAMIEALDKFGLKKGMNITMDSFDVFSDDTPYVTLYSRGSRKIVVVNIDIKSFDKLEVV